MKRVKSFASALLVTVIATGVALAQSSGNFSYGNTGTTHCVLNNNGTGSITGGDMCSQQTGNSCTANADCDAGTTCVIPTGATLGICTGSAYNNKLCGGQLKAGIKTSSGAGNVLVVRPSAVVGLLTDVTVQKNSTIDVGTSSALAGVDFELTAKGLSGQADPNVIPSFPVTYAARFIQISTNLFNVLGTLCTAVANPNPVGGVTDALGCYISFSESTVSAHSFDWIVGAPKQDGTGTLASGNYGITVGWSSSLGNTGISRSMTCVGPVNLTVQQNKVFSFNTPNTF